jgi:uncharacterized damage-inducible protein DinB
MPTPQEIAGIKAKLDAERAQLLHSFDNVSPTLLLQPVGPGGWSIKDLLAHVASSEDVNVKFARLMVAQDAPVQLRELASEFPDFPGEFELDKFNAWMTERGRAQSREEVVAALERVRKETLLWLDSLTPAQFERSGEHAVWGKQSVYGMLRILVIHDRFHRADIEKIVQQAA